MLQIPYLDMFNKNFQIAVSKLRSWDGFIKKDPRLALNFGKITKAMEQEMKEAQEVWGKVLLEYAKKDEKGELIVEKHPDGSSGYHILEDKLVEFREAEKKHSSNTLEIQRNPVKLEDLVGCSLTPDELVAIECLMTDAKNVKPIAAVKEAPST